MANNQMKVIKATLKGLGAHFKGSKYTKAKYMVSGRQSHVESSAVIRHRPHAEDRGDYGSSIDSAAPSQA